MTWEHWAHWSAPGAPAAPLSRLLALQGNWVTQKALQQTRQVQSQLHKKSGAQHKTVLQATRIHDNHCLFPVMFLFTCRFGIFVVLLNKNCSVELVAQWGTLAEWATLKSVSLVGMQALLSATVLHLFALPPYINTNTPRLILDFEVFFSFFLAKLRSKGKLQLPVQTLHKTGSSLDLKFQSGEVVALNLTPYRNPLTPTLTFSLTPNP